MSWCCSKSGGHWMPWANLLLLSLFLAHSASGQGVCYRRISTQETAVAYSRTSYRYRTSCGWNGWSTCTRTGYRQISTTTFRTVYSSLFGCCSGYSQLGNTCNPICIGNCNGRGICVTPNVCSCNAGWTLNDCSEDIDECSSSSTNNCEQVCNNTAGSYTCSCNTGYTLDSNGRTCTDIHECNDMTDNCEHICHNTAGSFYCSCRTGYSLSSDEYSCIMCGGAPNCSELFRQPCSSVTNTCGPCNLRHIATVVAESSRHSNTECFDPCVDGVMNYNETGVDCGGSLCPPCFSNQTCSDESDCGIGSVCLGYYKHPSGLSYLSDTARANTCGPETLPGMAILSRFKNAFKGRDNPLSSLGTQLFSREQLEAALVEELQAQFTVRGSLEVSVTELLQGEGDILYQVDAIFEEDVSFAIMKDNIHSGKLLGTVLFNLEARKALYNI